MLLWYLDGVDLLLQSKHLIKNIKNKDLVSTRRRFDETDWIGVTIKHKYARSLSTNLCSFFIFVVALKVKNDLRNIEQLAFFRVA